MFELQINPVLDPRKFVIKHQQKPNLVLTTASIAPCPCAPLPTNHTDKLTDRQTDKILKHIQAHKHEGKFSYES